jgi:cytochrome c-type biogenesis protein CcmE
MSFAMTGAVIAKLVRDASREKRTPDRRAKPAPTPGPRRKRCAARGESMSSSVKVALTVAVAVGGILFLAFQSAGDVEYYATVDKVAKNPGPWLERKTIQLHGHARKVPLQGTIVGQTVTRTFELEAGDARVKVVHVGPIPDTFKEEAETVVKGSLARAADGTLVLTTVGGEMGIMAKCPSKYEGSRS